MRDERLTTAQAHVLLSIAEAKSKKRRESIDAASAVLILQEYLDTIKGE
jgi:RNase H-fold protein (predicted Holliday junction resolvase)